MTTRRVRLSRARLSPQARLRAGLQVMARALTAARAWTRQARAAYRVASFALDRLPVVNAANPTGPTTSTPLTRKDRSHHG